MGSASLLNSRLTLGTPVVWFAETSNDKPLGMSINWPVLDKSRSESLARLKVRPWQHERLGAQAFQVHCVEKVLVQRAQGRTARVGLRVAVVNVWSAANVFRLDGRRPARKK